MQRAKKKYFLFFVNLLAGFYSIKKRSGNGSRRDGGEPLQKPFGYQFKEARANLTRGKREQRESKAEREDRPE